MNDKADIFVVGSTNGGLNWDGPYRVNSDSTTNDQWQPVIIVKPDGTKLFAGWYDRRNDANNSLIQIHGAFADLPLNTNSFATNLLISTAQFPPVFTGTNDILGAYDTAYPPHFDDCDSRCCGSYDGTYKAHMGDYDTAVSDNNYVYYTWSDKRNTSTNHAVTRNQADIRFIRVSWPR